MQLSTLCVCAFVIFKGVSRLCLKQSADHIIKKRLKPPPSHASLTSERWTVLPSLHNNWPGVQRCEGIDLHNLMCFIQLQYFCHILCTIQTAKLWIPLRGDSTESVSLTTICKSLSCLCVRSYKDLQKKKKALLDTIWWTLFSPVYPRQVSVSPSSCVTAGIHRQLA